MSIDHIHDTNSLENAVAYRIYYLGRLLRQHLNHYFQEQGLDIRQEQWFILFRLYENPGLSQSELVAKDLNDHPNITRMIDQLAKRGLVKRETDPEDRRKHLVSLTDEGQEFMVKILPQISVVREQVFAGISQNNIDELLRIFRLIEENITL